MTYQTLSMEKYPRRSHFEYFRSLAFPYVGLTVNVDITRFRENIKAQGLPFFLSFCYCVSRAANRVPEFRQRIMGDGIVQFDNCPTSHTVALKNGTYCYCELTSNLPFADFIPYAIRAQDEARKKATIDETDSLDKLFISCLPWLSYTALIQPVPIPADSNPRITWGKFFSQGDQFLLPVTVQCHHALVDGVHIARFFDTLQDELRQLQ